MKKIKLSLLLLSCLTIRCMGQSSAPIETKLVLNSKQEKVVFDKTITNSVQNVGEKDERENEKIVKVEVSMNDSKPSSVSGNAQIFPLVPSKTEEKTESTYVRKSKQDAPVIFSNGLKENYKRKTQVDIPVDYSNGVADTYVRNELLNSKEPKIQNEKSNAVDKNSSVHSFPVRISSKPSAINESTPSSITDEPSNRNSAINNPTRLTSSGKSSID